MSLSDYDELDKRIIELLCRSSQGSYRQLAKQLDVHPRLGFEYMGLVSVYADNVDTVQDEIIKIPQVISVFDLTGESDCVAWIACLDRDEFSDVVKGINRIPGVQKTNTSVILNIKKDPFAYIPPILGER